MLLDPTLITAPTQGFAIYDSGVDAGLPNGGLKFVPTSTVDFTNVNIIGLNVVAKFA